MYLTSLTDTATLKISSSRNNLFSRLAQHGLWIELEIFQRTPAPDNARAIYEVLNTCIQELGIIVPTPDPSNDLETRGWFRLWGRSRAGTHLYDCEKLEILSNDPYKFSALLKYGKTVQAAVALAKPALIFGSTQFSRLFILLIMLFIAPVAGPVIWHGHVCCAPNLMGTETVRVDDDDDVSFDQCLP